MNSSGAGLFAKHPTIANLFVGLTDNTATVGIDPITFCVFRGGTPSADASTYEHSCIALYADGVSLDVYVNTGTYASPVWTNIGQFPVTDIALAQGKTLVGNVNGSANAVTQYASVSANSTGSTLAPLLSNPGYAGSITGIQIISWDGTNGTITISINGTTLATIPKGSANVVTGGSFNSLNGFTATGSVNISLTGTGSVTAIATFVSGQ